MWLAAVKKLYPDDLICDLAECYGILNYTELSFRLVATLAQGLRANSRIWTKIMLASQEEKKEYKSFKNAEAFEEARRKIMEG